MLRSRIQQVAAVLVLGVLVIGGTVWALKPQPVKADPNKVQYLYCRNCEKEFMFERTKQDLKDPCPLCGKLRTPLNESIKKTQLKNPYTKMMTFAFIEFVAVLGALLFVLRRRESNPDDDFNYTHCPKCRQKIRYTDRQVGKEAVCRRCKTVFEFPELEAVR